MILALCDGENVRHVVDVPAGALSKDTIISIRAPIPWLMIVDLGTDGLVFNKRVEVELNYSGQFVGSTATKNYCLIHWDEKSMKWEQVEDASISYGEGWLRAEFSADHFSRYAVSER